MGPEFSSLVFFSRWCNPSLIKQRIYIYIYYMHAIDMHDTHSPGPKADTP
jgi:hypothetical protein